MDPTPQSPSASATVSERPRLNLKPRDPQAAKAEEERRRQELERKGNPFGAARPREAVLADRTGKREDELLAEEARNAKLNLRLNAQQLEEKRAAEALVAETKAKLEAEGDATLRAEYEVALEEQEAALEELIKKFEASTLEKIERGEIARQSELRARQQQQQMALGAPVPPYAAAGMPGAPMVPPPNAYVGGRGNGMGGRGGGFAGNYGGGRGGYPTPNPSYPQPPYPQQQPGQPQQLGPEGGRGGGRGYGYNNYNNAGGRGDYGGRGRGRGGMGPAYPAPPPPPRPQNAAAGGRGQGGNGDFFDSFGAPGTAPAAPPGFQTVGGGGYKQDRF